MSLVMTHVIAIDPSLDFDAHIESEFYISDIQPGRNNICCHCCAGTNHSPVILKTSLKAPEEPYSIVLPIFEECMDKGRLIIVHTAR
jgi:hypothetical protein